MRPSGLLVLALLGLCAGFGRTAEIDYLLLVEADSVKALMGRHGLYGWRSSAYDAAGPYRQVRAGLVALLEQRLIKDGKLPAGVRLAGLPEPTLNRMALTLLRKKGALLKTPGEELALMAKVLRDSHTVLWTQLGGARDTELEQALARPPSKEPPFYLNCSQFINYVAYMAGLPQDAKAERPSFDLTKIRPSEVAMLDTSMLGRWRGWWRPAAAPSGEIYSYNAVTLMPGDLIVMFEQKKIKDSLLEARRPKSYQFFHVEMVVESDDYDPTHTRSIGNSGKEPHFSDLLSRWSRLELWVEENYPYVNYETTNDWQHVVYKLQQNRELPATLSVP